MIFRLEGELSGEWVTELKNCWRAAAALEPPKYVRVDLTEVTFIDAKGKDLLALMYRHGAKFVARDVLTKGVVEEIERDYNRPVVCSAESRSFVDEG
ncbi:MAG TPA: STAS domain-containing protein [Blastocatellia bacterium]|nr:STAS domain-containing protein [Blastocatellia bacterium]